MSLRDRKAVVTGGPTREWLDPVRFITNPSSGKMGIALADAVFARARETVFIHGPINDQLLKNKKYRSIRVETTEDLLHAVLEEIEDGSVLIMAAAPGDYRPLEKSMTKIKKSGGDITVRLTENPDILKRISEKRERGELQGIFVVGFAAETANTEVNAVDKMKQKRLDMICLNDVTANGAGFGSDTNLITVFTRDGRRIELPMLSKESAAERIIDEIVNAVS